MLSGSFADQLDQLPMSCEAGSSATEAHVRHQRPTIVTGHNLGGALATLFVMENGASTSSTFVPCALLLRLVSVTPNSCAPSISFPSTPGES